MPFLQWDTQNPFFLREPSILENRQQSLQNSEEGGIGWTETVWLELKYPLVSETWFSISSCRVKLRKGMRINLQKIWVILEHREACINVLACSLKTLQVTSLCPMSSILLNSRGSTAGEEFGVGDPPWVASLCLTLSRAVRGTGCKRPMFWGGVKREVCWPDEALQERWTEWRIICVGGQGSAVLWKWRRGETPFQTNRSAEDSCWSV